ncbi:MAG: anthranilate synthase component I [Kiritimatiellia bacterium]|jgi:anthranilate synthase component 1|nr:anthranilate synthase component I [Kiritimatiellia bacterium]
MIRPSRDEYIQFAQEYDVVPVYAEVLADTETPLSVLQRFSDCENAFLLESLEGGENWGRYSFVGVDPELLLDADHSKGRTGELEALKDVYRGIRMAEIPGLPRFCGGAVGFMGYEAIGEFEKMPIPKPRDGDISPETKFLKADQLIVFDNFKHTVKVVVCTRPGDGQSAENAYGAAVARIEQIVDMVSEPVKHTVTTLSKPIEFSSNMTPEEFRDVVKRTKEYIVAGDIIQAVLSQRFSTQADIDAIQLYRALRFLNPSPYTFFMKIGGQTLVGSSPEIMVRLTGNKVEVRPIAGTRPRGKTEQEDRMLADELLADEKEKAEHVMLVDLGRNDLGRVSESGSVQVTEYMVIERYSHVMHMVSHVQGILRKEFDAYDVVKATFPAGTLSGAPKIRAMEIIHELEESPRGAYGGALGYIDYSGNMDLAITIRTLNVQNGCISVQAGAGIVYDSDPQKEFEETCHKARAMQKAVAMAARGLEVADD